MPTAGIIRSAFVPTWRRSGEAFVKQDCDHASRLDGSLRRDDCVVIGDQTSNPSHVTPAARRGPVDWKNPTTPIEHRNAEDRIARVSIWTGYVSEPVGIVDASGSALSTQSVTTWRYKCGGDGTVLPLTQPSRGCRLMSCLLAHEGAIGVRHRTSNA
jgi:hypothetical protein